MKKRTLTVLKISLSLALMAILTINAAAATVPKMTKEELRAMLDNPDVIVVDVRIGRDWKASEYKIKGAVRVGHSEVKSWASRYGKDKTFVIYCA
jgi:hypothetical protein